MPILKSFNFAPIPDLHPSPEQHRRIKLVERLQEQKALLVNPNHQRTAPRWVERDGNRVREDQQVNVKRWWSQTPDGKVILMPKFGLRPIEFEKGKPGILLEKESQLGAALDNLIAATNAGELDPLLSKAKSKPAKS